MTLFASSVTASAAVDYAELAEQKAIEFLQDKAGMMPQKRAMSAARLGRTWKSSRYRRARTLNSIRSTAVWAVMTVSY